MKGFICVFVTWMVSKFSEFYVGEISKQKNETTFTVETLVSTKDEFDHSFNVKVQISVKVTEQGISIALVDADEVKSAYIKIDSKSSNVFQMLSLAFDALVAHYVFNFTKALPY